jgi:hypothetical protein
MIRRMRLRIVTKNHRSTGIIVSCFLRFEPDVIFKEDDESPQRELAECGRPLSVLLDAVESGKIG